MLLLLLACSGPKPDSGGDSATDSGDGSGLACPRPAGVVAGGGDANGDGVVDLADAVLLYRAAGEGGPAPACLEAVDLIPDARVELDDGLAVVTALYEAAFPLPDPGDCAGAAGLAPPACADLRLTVAAVDGGAELRLAGAVPVEGWSVGVTVEGCSLVSATTAGTHAAPLRSPTPGVRDRGYDATRLVDGGAVSVVVLDLLEPVALPAEASLLRLGLTRGEGCSCTVRTSDALAWLGGPIPTVAVSGGAAWPLATEATVDLCGG